MIRASNNNHNSGVMLKFDEGESMRVKFQNGMKRDLFYRVIKDIKMNNGK